MRLRVINTASPIASRATTHHHEHQTPTRKTSGGGGGTSIVTWYTPSTRGRRSSAGKQTAHRRRRPSNPGTRVSLVYTHIRARTFAHVLWLFVVRFAAVRCRPIVWKKRRQQLSLSYTPPPPSNRHSFSQATHSLSPVCRSDGLRGFDCACARNASSIRVRLVLHTYTHTRVRRANIHTRTHTRTPIHTHTHRHRCRSFEPKIRVLYSPKAVSYTFVHGRTHTHGRRRKCNAFAGNTHG